MRGNKREEDLRNKRIVIHVTQKEKDIVQAIAERKGMEVSTYLRTICIYDQWIGYLEVNDMVVNSMQGFVFLGLNEGFWLVGLPFGILLFWVEYRNCESDNKRIDELTSRLPNEKIYLDISGEEQFMLENLSKRESMTSEKYIRSILKTATKKGREDFE